MTLTHCVQILKALTSVAAETGIRAMEFRVWVSVISQAYY